MAFKFLNKENDKPSLSNKPVVFLVEGQDDGIVLEQLLTERKEDENSVQVQYVKGISKLWDFLAAVVKSPQFTDGVITRICVIIDADGNFKDTETAAKLNLKKSGLAEPSSGEILKKDNIHTGLYILPNSKDNGELEDLIIQALGDDEKIQDSIKIIQKHQPNGEDFKKRSKRIIQVSLALNPADLCAGVGRGIRNGAINVGIEQLKDLSEFIGRFIRIDAK